MDFGRLDVIAYSLKKLAFRLVNCSNLLLREIAIYWSMNLEEHDKNINKIPGRKTIAERRDIQKMATKKCRTEPVNY